MDNKGFSPKIPKASVLKTIKPIVMPFFSNKRIKEWSGLPDIVVIENTNHCNARCIMCPNYSMRRKKGVMSFELYQRIIDESIELGIDKVQIAGTGEPLIDPLIFERIQYAKKSGIKVIKIFTNAALLDSQKQERLLSSGIDKVIISIDSFSPKNFESIRVGLLFEIVKKNVLSLLKTKKESGKQNPFILITGLNIKNRLSSSIDHDFYQEAIKLSNGVEMLEEGNVHDWSGHIEGFNIIPIPWYNLPCRRLWGTLNVLWDGTIPLCCIDYEGSVKLGDINKQTIKEVWNGSVINKLRNFHLAGGFNKIELCNKCFERPSWIRKKIG